MAKQTKMKPRIAKKKAAAKKKVTVQRKAVRAKAASTKKVTPKKAIPKKAVAKKVAKKVQPAVKKKSPRPRAGKETRSPERSTLSGATFAQEPRRPSRGTGSEFAGQSGDLQGLSRKADVDSESVEELAAEGQYYEAEVVGAVENALDPDEGELETHEVPEDDVPEEYNDRD